MRATHALVTFFAALLGSMTLALAAARAGDDPVLSASSDVVVVGERAAIAVSLETGDTPVIGWEFDLCNDNDLVVFDIDDIVPGDAIASASFTTYVLELIDSGWSASATISEPLAPGATHTLYTVTYGTNRPGTCALTFCEAKHPNVILTETSADTPLVEGGTVEIPTLIYCTSGSDIDVSWFADDYGDLDVIVDGEVIATIPGSELGYTYHYDGDASRMLSIAVAENPAASPFPRTIGTCEVAAIAASDIEVCEEPDIPVLGGGSPVVRELEVGTAGSVARLEMELNLDSLISTDFFHLFLESPSGTTIEVINPSGSATGTTSEGIRLFVTDDGVPYGTLPLTCKCTMKPYSIETMGAFEGEPLEGVWSIEMKAGFLFIFAFSQTLNEWCLRFNTCGAEVPPSVSCAASATDDVLISWSNTGVFDAVDVFRDRVLIATLSGTATTYIDRDPAGGRLTYSVRGRVTSEEAACAEPAPMCEVVHRATDSCVKPDVTLEPGRWHTTQAIPVETGGGDVATVEVTVEGTFVESSGPLTVELESPAGTTVQIEEATVDPLDVTYSPFGALWAFRPAGLMHPRFSLLDEFAGEPADGDWNLFIRLRGDLDFTSLTLDRLCLRVFDAPSLASPDSLTCSADGDAILLSWSNHDEYDELVVHADGFPIASLKGDATELSIPGVVAGHHGFLVEGKRLKHPRAQAGSSTCSLDVGILERCASRDLSIGPGGTVASVIDIVDSLAIDDVAVRLDLLFEDDETTKRWNVALTAPDGTTIELLDPGSDSVDEVQVTFSDAAPFPPANDNAFELDWPECGCRLHPFGGNLRDLRGFLSTGEWTLTVTCDGNSDGGVLSEWCLALYGECDLATPGDLIADTQGDDIELTWTNSAPYDGIDVARSGVVVASLAGGATSYLDAEPSPGRHEYALHVTDPTGCRRATAGVTAYSAAPQACSDTGTLSAPTYFTDEVAIEADVVVGEVELSMDIEAGMKSAWLESPRGTRIRILGRVLNAPPVTFTLRLAQGGRPYDGRAIGDGVEMRPAVPGDLAAFRGEAHHAGDTWRLSVEDGILHGWCLRIIPLIETPPPPAAPPEFLRGDADQNGSVSPLTDALYLLRAFFTDAGPVLVCSDAADVNDNGDVSGLGDAVLLLRWGYLEGAPPKAPGPVDCGEDPTADSLDCMNPEGCN